MRHRTTSYALALLLSLVAGGQSAAGQGCLDGRQKTGWLGITSLRSSGVSIQRHDDDLRVWFRQEPRVQGIFPGGPADGALRKGDVLTALDGQLITTRAAGQKLVSPPPGVSVSLNVRREGSPLTVEVTPLEMCPEDIPVFWSLPAPPAPPAPPAVPSPPSPPAPPAPSVSPSPPAPPAAPAPPAPPAPPVPPAPPAPDGWFGFGFECSDCGWEKPDPDREAAFRFREPPAIYSVDPHSPAERAGLKRGDVLTHVDGLPLTSAEGSRRFFDLQPGQKIRFGYRRSGQSGEVEMTAVNPPYRRSWRRVYQRTESFRKELEKAIGDAAQTGDAQRLRETIDEQISGFVKQLQELNTPLAEGRHNLRYAGNLSGVDVEVRGLGTVDVAVDEGGSSLVIRTLDATIRLSRSPQGRPQEQDL